jgi:hypothetical protein
MHRLLGCPRDQLGRLGHRGQGLKLFVPPGIIVVIFHHSKWFRLKDLFCDRLKCKFRTKRQVLVPKTYRIPRLC